MVSKTASQTLANKVVYMEKEDAMITAPFVFPVKKK